MSVAGFRAESEALSAPLIYAPMVGETTLVNYGALATLPAGSLINGLTLGAGLLYGGNAGIGDGIDDYINTNWKTRTNLAPTPYITGGSVGLCAADARVEVATATKAWSLIADESLVSKTKEILASNTYGCRMRVSLANKSGMPVTAGATITACATVKAPTARKVAIYSRWYNAEGTEIAGSNEWGETAVPANTPTKVWASKVAPAGAVFCQVCVCHQGVTVGEEVLWDGIFIASGSRAEIEAQGEFFPTPEQVASGFAGWSGEARKSASDIGPWARGTSRTFVMAVAANLEDEDVFFGSNATNAGKGPYFGVSVSGGVNFHNGTEVKSTAAATLTAKTTSIVAATYDSVSGNYAIYVNGVSKASGTFTVKNFAEAINGNLIIGARSTSLFGPFKGSLLPGAVFLTALTEAQIKTITTAALSEPIPEQLAAAAVDDTLKHATIPNEFSKLPWDTGTGTWTEAEGWRASGFTTEADGANTNASAGIYYRPENLQGGNAFSLVTWNAIEGSLSAGRQFSLWLFANVSDATPDGYQLSAYQNAASASSGKTFVFKLRKWVAGVPSLLRENEATMEKGGAFALVKAGGLVSIWIKASSASPFKLLSTEGNDAAFTEGYAGLDGNGSNPRLANFATGVLTVGILPTATTEDAVELHKEDVKIAGSANPKGASTSVWWEYGTTQSYGYKTSVTNIGSGNANVQSTLKLEGLKPGTLYHFRLVAENAFGRTTAAELTFTTTGRKAQRRRKPKLGLDVEIETPDGTYRLPANAKNPRNLPRNITFGTQRGEGFSIATVALSREIFKDYPDLNLLDTWRFINAAGEIVYEGRLLSTPRQNDPEEEITINLIGWMSYLKGRKIAPLYVDARLTSWEGPSTQRRINLLAAARPQQQEAQVTWGGGGLGLHLEVQNGWASPTIPICETWFNPGTETVYAIYGDWLNGSGDLGFQLFVSFCDDEVGTGLEGSGDYYTTTTGHISWGPATGKRYAFLQWWYAATPAGYEGGQWCVDVTNLKVQGTSGARVPWSGTWPNTGPMLSGIMEDVVETYYPKLKWAGEANTFPVEQATWHDSPTDGYEILKQLNNLALWELNCWAERTIYYERADLTKIDWQFKTTDPGVKANFEGDSIENIANGCSVHYTDFAGVSHTLWPSEYAQLRDESSDNPYNKHGEIGWTDCDVPYECTLIEALQFGQVYLAEFNRPKRPGSYTISGGYIKNAAGHWRAGFDVRNGQTCGIMDKMDDEPRLITATQWDDANKSLTITVDAPEQLIEAIVGRQSIARTVKGVQ